MVHPHSLSPQMVWVQSVSQSGFLTRKKNKHKLSRPTTTKKKKKPMVTSILMLLKENKTNFTFAIWILQSCNYTTKFVCSFSCPSALQFAINTYKAQHSQQCTRAGRRNAQRTAKSNYFSLESFFFFFLWGLSSCKA